MNRDDKKHLSPRPSPLKREGGLPSYGEGRGFRIPLLSRERLGKGWSAAWIACVWAAITLLNMVLLPLRHAPSVEVEPVQMRPMPLMVRASGNLEAKDSNTIKIQFDGPILSKQFREGQQVVKGQLLAVVGTEKIRLDYQNKHDGLVNAQADLKKARTDVLLQKRLFKKEAVPYSNVEDAQRTLVKAEQTLRNALEAFQEEQDLWNSGKVYAPMAGTIVKDWIGDDKAILSGKELVTVADVSEFTVKARVDELDIKQVREGQSAHVRLQIYPDSVFQATVREVGSQPDGSALPEVPVVLRLQSMPGFALRPKLTAEVQILTGWTPPTLSVPLTAVANTDGNPHIWVLGLWSRLRLKSVDLGKSNPERVEVIKGLSLGQRICVTAEPDFADGMKVKIGRPAMGAAPQSRTNMLLSRLPLMKKPEQQNKPKPGPMGNFLLDPVGKK